MYRIRCIESNGSGYNQKQNQFLCTLRAVIKLNIIFKALKYNLFLNFKNCYYFLKLDLIFI